MDPAYISAFAALAGSAIGGLTSLTTSWLVQRTQLRAQQHGHELSRREDLYKHFIEEASKLYADAFEHDDADTSKLVNLYAFVSLMRVLSSRRVVETADRVVQAIVEAYLGPNRTFRDVRDVWGDTALDPLREFSSACREELRNASWSMDESPAAASA
jgi:hypothetical protein